MRRERQAPVRGLARLGVVPEQQERPRKAPRREGRARVDRLRLTEIGKTLFPVAGVLLHKGSSDEQVGIPRRLLSPQGVLLRRPEPIPQSGLVVVTESQMSGRKVGSERQGSLGGGVFETADCQKTFEELSARGVTFLQEPAERPYGIEALFRDDSGNWFSLTQPKWLG